LAIIYWRDSAFEGGWRHDKNAITPLPLIKSVGYVTHVDSVMVEVAGTMNENGGTLNPLAIPIGSVMKVKELNED
jgi:hypothetical protein